MAKLQELINIPPNVLLVTLDVTSLYNNIPHDEGIDACRAALNSRTNQQPPTEDLVQLMKLILARNNFTFDGKHFLQIYETAMGTRMAPSYANLFMNNLETRLLDSCVLTPLVWWRYINDIFALWPHGKENLRQFIEEINQFHP